MKVTERQVRTYSSEDLFTFMKYDSLAQAYNPSTLEMEEFKASLSWAK